MSWCVTEPARQPAKAGCSTPAELTQWDDYVLFLNARNGTSIRFTADFAARVPEPARPLLGTKNDKGEYIRELAEPGNKTWKGKLAGVLAAAGALVTGGGPS